MKAAKDLHLKAVYSRSRKSAQDLASSVSDIDLYSEDSGSGYSYADLLARDDIAAVIIGYVYCSFPSPLGHSLDTSNS